MSKGEMAKLLFNYLFDDLIILPNGSVINFDKFYGVFYRANNLDEIAEINKSENRGYESILEV